MKPRTGTVEMPIEKRANAHSGLVARILERKLSTMARGRITFHLPNGEFARSPGFQPGPNAHIVVHRWRALSRLWMEGDIGLAAGWIDGDWTSDDVYAVLSFGLENEEGLASSFSGSGVAHFFNRMRHGMRRNSRSGSKRNIAAHYDLGNAFYSHWLDEGMQYSSAIYENPAEDLASAQIRKLERITRMLTLRGGERVLEIGCGWGAVAEYLAADHDCHVTGITLSKEQAEFARARLSDSGIERQAAIELRDYRELAESYDRIVSIEMFEAVGMNYWQQYFDTLANSLRQGGNAVLQIITIDEKYFDQYRRKPDFIQKYIFPGGMLPTKAHLQEGARKAGFVIEEEFCFGDSYARTLDAWRRNFLDRWDAIKPLGFDDRFRRMWEYYLRYCEAGFNYGTIDVGLYKLVRA